VVVAFALFQRVSGYSKERYYHVINVPTYYTFVWAGEELPQSANALLLPDTAWAFYPVTGKYVFIAAAAPWGVDEYKKISVFFRSGASSTPLLVKINVDLLYSSRFSLNNPDLIEVRDKLYILREKGG
jgi:hypothetical protein